MVMVIDIALITDYKTKKNCHEDNDDIHVHKVSSQTC